MSDKNNTNDPLEQLFRNKSEEYDISFHEEDWEEMESRLDKWDAQRLQRYRRWLTAAAVLLVFSVLAYFTFKNYQQINRLNDRLSSYQNEESQQPDNQAMNQDPATPQSSKDGSTLAQNQHQNDQPDTEDAVSSGAGYQKSVADSNQGIENTEQQAQSFKEYPLTEQNLAVATLTPGFDGRLPAISAIKPTNSNLTSSYALATDSHDESNALGNSRDNMTKRKFTRASLGFIMGPDLSTTGSFGNFYDPGYKFGVTLEYNITPDFAISGGLIRTKVLYTASGDDYHPPQGYWTNGIVPDETVGKCVLLDIPLALKYNVLHFDNSRIYTSAGLSSYIMLNEHYRFNYEGNYQTNLQQSWSEKTGTKHWFSNATFSVGYEFDIANYWSVRAEPFVKLPLKEVGWGKVDLYSMGTLVSFNYNFSR